MDEHVVVVTLEASGEVTPAQPVDESAKSEGETEAEPEEVEQ